jgi:hypothetical protein
MDILNFTTKPAYLTGAALKKSNSQTKFGKNTSRTMKDSCKIT